MTAVPAPADRVAERVAFTDEAADLVRRLTVAHGPVMFHQSGGCCDGSSPMCYPEGDFLVGSGDVRLGEVEIEGLDQPVGFWMSESQFEYWQHTHLTIDVVDGRGGGFSLESPEGSASSPGPGSSPTTSTVAARRSSAATRS